MTLDSKTKDADVTGKYKETGEKWSQSQYQAALQDMEGDSALSSSTKEYLRKLYKSRLEGKEVIPQFKDTETEKCPECGKEVEREGKLDVTGLYSTCPECGYIFKDEAYDPTKPENIRAAKNLAIEQGEAGASRSKMTETGDGYKRMTLADLVKKAREGYFELQADPKPRNHVEVKYPDGKREWIFVEDRKNKDNQQEV